MSQQYSQLRAMLAISRASLRAIMRSPTTVVFSLAFPMIFILVFGFLGNGNGVSMRVAFSQQTDTTSVLYSMLSEAPGLKVVEKDSVQLEEDLQKGRLTAVLSIDKNASGTPAYTIHLKTSEAVNPQNLFVLRSVLEKQVEQLNRKQFEEIPTVANISNEVEKVHGREYRTIDFILPGQLGFSLLSAGIFGVAFLFFNLRQTLVLKRFFATPIRRSYIVFGEGLSRVTFLLLTAVVILLVGHFAFHFTLVHGVLTFFELLVLSFIGLIVFMGFGFVVSGLARNESTIPFFANMVTLPQFLLAGTFFPIDNFPSWLQPFCRILPLTYLNDAMRNVAFEGAHLTDCGKELGVLAIWAIVGYTLAVKVFKWE